MSKESKIIDTKSLYVNPYRGVATLNYSQNYFTDITSLINSDEVKEIVRLYLASRNPDNDDDAFDNATVNKFVDILKKVLFEDDSAFDEYDPKDILESVEELYSYYRSLLRVSVINLSDNKIIGNEFRTIDTQFNDLVRKAYRILEEKLQGFENRTYRQVNAATNATILVQQQDWKIPAGYEELKDIDFITTLAGYVHWKLTGEKVLGVGDASGMFPIDSTTRNWNKEMLAKFDELVAPKGYPWKVEDILPKVLVAGEKAGTLTEEGAKLLDPTGKLQAGIPVCPPEGDAGTGMAATNSVRVRTGNVSAGTSVFAMVVLEKALEKVHEEIDMVTTPAGDAVAMVHCNNCTSDLNAWVNIFKEFAEAFGMKVDMNDLFGTLYNKALEGDADCGGLMSYNYLA